MRNRFISQSICRCWWKKNMQLCCLPQEGARGARGSGRPLDHGKGRVKNAIGWYGGFSVLCKCPGHRKLKDKQHQQLVTVLNLLKINTRAGKCNFLKPGSNFQGAEPFLTQRRDFLTGREEVSLTSSPFVSGWAAPTASALKASVIYSLARERLYTYFMFCRRRESCYGLIIICFSPNDQSEASTQGPMKNNHFTSRPVTQRVSCSRSLGGEDLNTVWRVPL